MNIVLTPSLSSIKITRKVANEIYFKESGENFSHSEVGKIKNKNYELKLVKI